MTSTLLESLDTGERERAARFHFEHDRNRFIVAHGALRIILSRYLNVTPVRLRFGFNAYGKPSLDDEAGASKIRFNMSHSGGLALYAVAFEREIGVDVEYMRADLAGKEIAERFFSRRETEALNTLAPEVLTEAFFNCWTRKEAYIKARGEGLSHPLHAFSVSLVPGEPAALLSVEGDAQELARWTLVELMPNPDYKAALACEGRDWRLACYEFDFQ